MKNNKKISILLMFCIVFLILIIDLLSKHFTVGINQEFIPGFIKFLYKENTGAAWSIFEGGGISLIIGSFLAIILINIYAVFEKNNSKLLYVSLGLILGGAWGNLFDRLVFGYVRDFIKFEFMTFPVFNVADMALTIGVVLLLIFYIILLFKDGKEKRKENGK